MGVRIGRDLRTKLVCSSLVSWLSGHLNTAISVVRSMYLTSICPCVLTHLTSPMYMLSSKATATWLPSSKIDADSDAADGREGVGGSCGSDGSDGRGQELDVSGDSDGLIGCEGGNENGEYFIIEIFPSSHMCR